MHALSLLLLGAAISNPVAALGRWDGVAAPTIVAQEALVDINRYVAMETSAPKIGDLELLRRQFETTTRTCGYVNGYGMTCGAGYFCTVNANLVQGCCPSATPKCTLLNTCIDNTATSTYAASVLAANNVLGCPRSLPYCFAVLFPISGKTYTGLGCDTSRTTMTAFQSNLNLGNTATITTRTAALSSASSPTRLSSPASASTETSSISQTPFLTTPIPGPSSSDSSPKSTPVGAIVGGVVGGLAGLGLILLAVFFILKRRKSKNEEKNEAAPAFSQTLGPQHGIGSAPSLPPLVTTPLPPYQQQAYNQQSAYTQQSRYSQQPAYSPEISPQQAPIGAIGPGGYYNPYANAPPIQQPQPQRPQQRQSEYYGTPAPLPKQEYFTSTQAVPASSYGAAGGGGGVSPTSPTSSSHIGSPTTPPPQQYRPYRPDANTTAAVPYETSPSPVSFHSPTNNQGSGQSPQQYNMSSSPLGPDSRYSGPPNYGSGPTGRY